MNNKMIMDLAEQLGIDDMGKAQKKAASYQNKSDEEILKEITQLKETIKKDPVAFEKQLKAVKSLRAVMGSEQKARLDKIIRLLES